VHIFLDFPPILDPLELISSLESIVSFLLFHLKKLNLFDFSYSSDGFLPSYSLVSSDDESLACGLNSLFLRSLVYFLSLSEPTAIDSESDITPRPGTLISASCIDVLLLTYSCFYAGLANLQVS
jgi:hypothetical protein